MKVMHLIACGGIGGIESLMRDYARFSCHDNVFVFGWAEGVSADSIRASGKKIYCLKGHEVGSIRALIALNSICVAEAPDVVVAHNGSLLLFGAFLLSIRHRGLRVYQYVHYSPVYKKWFHKRIKEFIHDRIRWITLRNADKVIAISNYVKDGTMQCFHVPERQIEVIYNGIDLSRFTGADMRNNHDGKRIVYVGRIIEGKGVQIVLKALSMISVECHLDIVGDGPYIDELKRLTEALGLTETVTFWGNREDVQHFLKLNDIFVHVPILEEGFGITVVEAMAAGLTCVCSQSGGIPEIIHDGENGYLVEKEDPKALAKVLEYVICNYNNADNKEIRATARESVKSFSIGKYSSELDESVSKFKRGGVNLIYIGRLIPEKGVQTMIRALPLLPDHIHMTIVGDGDYRSDLEVLNERYGGRAVFLGRQTNVPQLLDASDIFIHTAEWEEGFGIAVVEAMAMGKICVVSKSGALTEIITEGVDGFIVEKSNPKMLADKIIEISNRLNSQEIEDIRQNAKKRASDFAIEKFSRKLDMLMERQQKKT